MSGRHLDSIPPRTVWKPREAVCSLIFPNHKQAAHNGWPIPSLAELGRHGSITSSRFLYLSGDECLPPKDPPPGKSQWQHMNTYWRKAHNDFCRNRTTSQPHVHHNFLSCDVAWNAPFMYTTPGFVLFSRFDIASDTATAPPVSVWPCFCPLLRVVWRSSC